MKNIKILLITILIAMPLFTHAYDKVTATRNIEKGEMFSADMVKIEHSAAKPADEEMCDAFCVRAFNAKYARQSIKQGETLYKNHFLPKTPAAVKRPDRRGEKLFSTSVPTMWRGYALETDAATFEILFAGSWVDILAKIKATIKQTQKEETVVFTLLQKIKVLDRVEADGKYYILLALDPRDAQYLILIDKEDIKITLRNHADTYIIPIPITANKIFEGGNN
ncbi:Flp pilus assembly protein CpaB [Elusimicrobium simillimum]|uniref:hypothetical protein n=1 Tax=Elusimicrobium simillimum TaxID=3143438 RepID=UPI003C6F917A